MEIRSFFGILDCQTVEKTSVFCPSGSFSDKRWNVLTRFLPRCWTKEQPELLQLWIKMRKVIAAVHVSLGTYSYKTLRICWDCHFLSLTHRSHGWVLVRSESNFTNYAVFGIIGPVLSKREGNCFSRRAIQHKRPLVEDHALLVKNHVRRAILVHPSMRSTMHLECNR